MNKRLSRHDFKLGTLFLFVFIFFVFVFLSFETFEFGDLSSNGEDQAIEIGEQKRIENMRKKGGEGIPFTDKKHEVDETQRPRNCAPLYTKYYYSDRVLYSGPRRSDCSVDIKDLHEFYSRIYPDSSISRFTNRVGEVVEKYHKRYMVEIAQIKNNHFPEEGIHHKMILRSGDIVTIISKEGDKWTVEHESGITKCSPNDLIVIGDIQPGVHDLVIGLNGEDHWMWPTDQIGEVVYMILDGRKVKVETLSLTPKVLQFDHLVSDNEIDHFLELGKRFKSDGTISVAKEGPKNAQRVRDGRKHMRGYFGKNIFPGDNLYTDDTVDSLVNRYHNLLKLNNSLGENLQMLYYEEGHFYHRHLDALGRGNYVDRIATILTYLVDTHGGGETSFPETIVNSSEPNSLCVDDHSCFAFCDTDKILKVRPRRGKSVAFYTLYEDKNMIKELPLVESSVHQACTLKSPEKWVVQQIIRNRPFSEWTI